MNSKVFLYFLFISVFVISPSLNGQETNTSFATINLTDSIYRPSKETAEMLYKQKFNKEFGYINGREYKPYFNQLQISPYFESGKGLGSIYTDGRDYKNLFLIYDLNLDELILLPTNPEFSKYYIKINKSTIDSFDIEFLKEKFRLVNFQFPNDSTIELKSGFYEIPYKGKYQYFIKHAVLITKTGAYDDYVYQKKKYLFMNQHFYSIDSKRKFLDLFHQNRKLLKKRIRKMNSWYKDLNNTQMISLIELAETF